MSDAVTNELHELLCAYLFDEVTPTEAQRLEAALDALPELRAERERLEQTIHLVHDAYQGEDKLPEAAVASLLEAAQPGATIHQMRPSRTRAVFQSPTLRAAAAVMLLSGSVYWTLAGDLGMDRVGTWENGLSTAALSPSHMDDAAASRMIGSYEIPKAQASAELRFQESVQQAQSGSDRNRPKSPEEHGVSAGFASQEPRFDLSDKLAADAWKKEASSGEWIAKNPNVAMRSLTSASRPALDPGNAKIDGGTSDVFTLGRESIEADGIDAQPRRDWARDDALRAGFDFKAEQSGLAGQQQLLEHRLSEQLSQERESAKPESTVNYARAGSVALGLSGKPAEKVPVDSLASGALFDQTGGGSYNAGKGLAGGQDLDSKSASVLTGAAGGGVGGGGVAATRAVPGTSRASGAQPLTRRERGSAAGDPGGQGSGVAAELHKKSITLAEAERSESLAEKRTKSKTRSTYGLEFGREMKELAAERELNRGERERLKAIGYVGADGKGEKESGTFYDSAVDGIDAGGVDAGGQVGFGADRYLRGMDVENLDLLGELVDESRGAATEFSSELSTLSGESVDLSIADGRFRGRFHFSAEQLEVQSKLQYERVLQDCRRHGNERPRDMYFRFYGDNAFALSQLDNLSTFSVDVDTASYVLARRYLREGHLPTKEQIRTEEFLNYFDADVQAPTEGDFTIETELAPSLFSEGREDRWLLRVGIRGREISKEQRKPLNLTFVIDTSGSMRENGRLELVKHAMRLLLIELDERDSIAIVAYSNDARVILPMTPATQRGLIESALHPLSPNGSTNAEAGLKMGYELASTSLNREAVNRVIFLSDGVANVGQTDQNRIAKDVQKHKSEGIYLNTIGVGMNNHNDVFLEQLANKGDGICDYVDDQAAARRAMVERFSGAFQPIASDVKVQVEFDPAQVFRYRLLGYENRSIADEDFRNDAVDAGEVGSGHQIVALYEIERMSEPATSTSAKEGSDAATKPLATVRLRWKAPKTPGQDPNEIDVTEMESTVLSKNALASFATASKGYRRSVLVGQFAEILRRSTHAAGDSYETLLVSAAQLEGELGDADFSEFLGMMTQAGKLILSERRPHSALGQAVDSYRRNHYRQAENDCLKDRLHQDRHPVLNQINQRLIKQNQDLEREIRDLIRQELLQRNG